MMPLGLPPSLSSDFDRMQQYPIPQVKKQVLRPTDTQGSFTRARRTVDLFEHALYRICGYFARMRTHSPPRSQCPKYIKFGAHEYRDDMARRQGSSTTHCITSGIVLLCVVIALAHPPSDTANGVSHIEAAGGRGAPGVPDGVDPTLSVSARGGSTVPTEGDNRQFVVLDDPGETAKCLDGSPYVV
jgi:hypothetical protein